MLTGLNVMAMRMLVATQTAKIAAMHILHAALCLVDL